MKIALVLLITLVTGVAILLLSKTNVKNLKIKKDD